MSDILVAGAGHGGLVAAMKLSRAGHHVTVIEQQNRKDCGLPQRDAFDAGAMEYAGIPIPQRYRGENNQVTFVPLSKTAPVLTLPKTKNEDTLTAERQDLMDYLITLAEDAGVRFCFGCAVLGPIQYGSRVVGLHTDLGDLYGDLIVDACGVHSPVRNGLRDCLHLDKDPAMYDLMHTYRAYFEKVPGVAPPETRYNFNLKDDGVVGFTWVVTEPDGVDVLIGRFHMPDERDIELAIEKLRADYPYLSRNLIRASGVRDIPVRAPMAVLVADGYAAVGDAAFMTFAVKGSGIAYAMRAGTMLAEAVLSDKDGLYTAETLWSYETTFFKEIGFGACRLAVMKNLLPYLTAQEVSDWFEKGLVTSEEMDGFYNHALETLVKSKVVPLLKDKIRVLGDVPESRAKFLDVIRWFGKFTVVEPFLPSRYDREDVARWAKKYKDVFDSIRKQDTEQE